ncbi:phospholipase D-like domain-containing protein [Clostridium butyricum]|uniref:phospholipase D-like domain-containing protein n=1 Tax=Clostridium butyricum TaxID=1492 RepID=UPI00374F014C
MNEKDFMKNLIALISHDTACENKIQILDLLKKSYLKFDKTDDFTRKTWQFWENIELRAPIPLIEEAENYREYLENKCRDIYIETDDYDFSSLFIKPGDITVDDEFTSQSVYFEEIQSKIIDEIRKAKYIIWIAVAWFTDSVLFDELIKKKAEGVNVQVIINDDYINSKGGLKFEDLSEFHKIPPTGYFSNIMHHKFCIIDLRTVLEGSYNWTKKAQFNDETLSIDTNRSIAEKFADKFIALKNE